MKRSSRYVVTAISSLALLSLVIMPIVAYNYLTDANVRISINQRSSQELTTHLITEDDVARFPQIRDGLINSEKIICESGYQPCQEAVVSLKTYEVDIVRKTFELNNCSNAYTFCSGIVEYNGKYYFLVSELPQQQFLAYEAYGAIVTAIGGTILVFLWVKYGHNRLMKRTY